MINIGDLVNYKKHWTDWTTGKTREKLGIVIESRCSPPIRDTSCFDGPTGESRTRVAWCDGTGLQWVNTNHLTKEKN